MTRARALKQIIRARAARTGERYTTARRHVLSQLDAVPPPARAAGAAPPAATTKGGLSDAKAREKTGRGLDHWFAVLDAFGGVARGHTALARHLREDHGVPSWYCQGITVAYERTRGARAMNQRCDGVFEVSASKVMPALVPNVTARLTDPRQRKRWAGGVHGRLADALAAGLKAPKSKGVVMREDGQARLRYKWGETAVQIYFYPRAQKTSMVVTNSGLADSAMVAARRSEWRAALDAIARTFA